MIKNIIKFILTFIFIVSLIMVSKQLFASMENIHRKISPSNIITLDFKKIPIRELLEFFAQKLNYNIIMSESVTGAVSLHFHDISWQGAFDLILDMTGLVKRQRDNVLIIGTPREFAQRQQNLSEALPLKYVKLKLKHVDAGEVATILKSQTELLSSVAKISINTRDNSLWFKESVENIPEILQFLHQLDVPEKQIMIAAKIVNVDDNKVNELGIRFKETQACSDQKGFHISLPEENLNRISFAIANLAQNHLLELELVALENSGYSKVVADPKLITQNHKSATIEAGEEIPYQEKTSSGATNVSFKKAALSLKVTPTITPDHRIALELEISQNKMSSLSINGTPAIQTQELKTQVIVNNGETVILGGIFEKSDAEIVDKVPLLGYIPVVGQIFRHEDRHCSRKELLIFVTPQILSDP